MNTFLEKNLEDSLFEHIKYTSQVNFPALYKNVERQLKTPATGRIMDIFSWETDASTNCFMCKIIELKRGKVGVSAITQASDYFLDILMYAGKFFNSTQIEIILCGSSFTEDAKAIILASGNMSAYSYDMSGSVITYTKESGGIKDVKDYIEKFPSSLNFMSSFHNKLNNRNHIK